MNATYGEIKDGYYAGYITFAEACELIAMRVEYIEAGVITNDYTLQTYIS